MSRARGNRLQNALADYLAGWWQHAESAGAGRQGTDVLGTPGVVWECKTASEFKRDFRPMAWVKQALGHRDRLRDVPVVVYFPPGVGATNVGQSLAIVPLHVLMRVLTEAGYTPGPEARSCLDVPEFHCHDGEHCNCPTCHDAGKFSKFKDLSRQENAS